eukprot:SM000039S14457  [mRNA]  locus=s39:201437:213849:- [translate_table: standard]
MMPLQHLGMEGQLGTQDDLIQGYPLAYRGLALWSSHRKLRCRLLVQWSIVGREPVEVLRLAAGLWFTERRALILSLQLLLRMVVLDEGADLGITEDVQAFLQGLMAAGLRARLLALVKELNREEPAGLGGPSCEPYVMDARGTLVLRQNVVQRERLMLAQCLVYTCLIAKASSTELSELLDLLRACAQDWAKSKETVKLQTAYTVMFALVVSLISDSLGAGEGHERSLIEEEAFQKSFQEQVMTPVHGSSAIAASAANVLAIVKLAWGVCQLGVGHNNDDPDLLFMYHVYLHKLLSMFLSLPPVRGKIKELKEQAQRAPDPDPEAAALGSSSTSPGLPFVSLLGLIGRLYEAEPSLAEDNQPLWAFVLYAGEDHRGWHTLVAFLHMLAELATGEEGPREVHRLLQGRALRLVSWRTLFSTLTAYQQRCQQLTMAFLGVNETPAVGAGGQLFLTGDTKALEAYLGVLVKVMQEGNESERGLWAPVENLEALFALLPYDKTPPRLRGALRSAIAALVPVSPIVRDCIWALMEQYDLPVSAGPAPISMVPGDVGSAVQLGQVYDMVYELEEVEARVEEYPSTLSYLKLLNNLMAAEPTPMDQGLRYLDYFKFVRDHVFTPYAQRSYVDPAEKWGLVLASLTHFQCMLTVYEPSADDIATTGGPPGLEIMRDLMAGRTIFRNIMSILSLGPDVILEGREASRSGMILEASAKLCLEILVLAFDRDSVLADKGRPSYQPLESILANYDRRQMLSLLEYVRYDALPDIQRSSIRLMSILSARLPKLVAMIIEGGKADRIVEDYGACLEIRMHEIVASPSLSQDNGFLIMQASDKAMLLLEGLTRQSPNVPELLLRFDVEGAGVDGEGWRAVQRSVLQPRREFSCLRVILDMLDTLPRPEVNYRLHESGFQLLYELQAGSATCTPIAELLRGPSCTYFSHHLPEIDTMLPKRGQAQALRVSVLHQRAWLLKLLTLEIHGTDISEGNQHQSCRGLIDALFLPEPLIGAEGDSSLGEVVGKSKLAELVGEEEQNLFAISERGDRLIDIAALRDAILQGLHKGRAANFAEGMDTVLRWAWAQNCRLEEEAAQLHLLLAISNLIQVVVSRRLDLLEPSRRLQTLADLLDASLTSLISPDCSLKMALPLSQVALTVLAKLQQLSLSFSSFLLSPSLMLSATTGEDVDLLSLLSPPHLSNSACHQTLSRLLSGLLRSESSEPLRRRLLSSLLCYLRYCQGRSRSDLPPVVISTLLASSGEGVIEKVHQEQVELTAGNLALVRKSAPALAAILAKDAMRASEVGRALAMYAMDAILALEGESLTASGLKMGMGSVGVMFEQLQSRGILQASLADVASHSRQVTLLSAGEASARGLYIAEAELALLLRAATLGKSRGALSIVRMGALRQLSSCRALDAHVSTRLFLIIVSHVRIRKFDDEWRPNSPFPSQAEKHYQLFSRILRLVLCMATLASTSSPSQDEEGELGTDSTSLQVIDFVDSHRGAFARALRDESRQLDSEIPPNVNGLHLLELTTAILSRVWASGQKDAGGIRELLLNLCTVYFTTDQESRSKYIRYVRHSQAMPALSHNIRQVADTMTQGVTRLRCNLITYLRAMVVRGRARLHLDRAEPGQTSVTGLGLDTQPTLRHVAQLLKQTATSLQAEGEEKSILLSKLEDVNELSRHEVDEIIDSFSGLDASAALTSLRDRRHAAMQALAGALSSSERRLRSLVVTAEQALELLQAQIAKQVEAAGISEISSQPPTMTSDVEALGELVLPSLDLLENLSEERIGQKLQYLRQLIQFCKSSLLHYDAT